MKDAIFEVSGGLEEKIRSDLANVDAVSATSDIWTDVTRRHWATVTVHWIDKHTFEFRSINIGCVPIQEKSSVAIAELIEAHTKKFLSSKTKLIAVVTDQGADILAGCRLIEETLNSDKHMLISCIAHVLHNSVTEALEDDFLISLIREMCVFFRNNDQISSICEYRFLKDQDTRWSSIYFMLLRFVDLTPTLESKCSSILKANFFKDLNDFEFNQSWSNLVKDAKTLCSILKPFYSVTEFVQGESYITISAIPKLIHQIQTGLIPDPQRNSEIEIQLKQKLKWELDKRVEHVFKTNNIYLLAAFLDPKYNELEFITLVQREEVKNNLISLCQKMYPPGERPEMTDEIMIRMSPEELDEYLRLLSEGTTLVRVEIAGYESVVAELRKNTTCRISSQAFWKSRHEFPLMRKLSAALLSIPGSSAKSERAFSIMGRIISKTRTSALPETSQSRFIVAENMPRDMDEIKRFLGKELPDLTRRRVARIAQGNSTTEVTILE